MLNLVKRISFLRNSVCCYKVLETWHGMYCYGLIYKRCHSVTRNPSSAIWLQVLQSGQRDASPGLYVFTDSNRYVAFPIDHLRNRLNFDL